MSALRTAALALLTTLLCAAPAGATNVTIESGEVVVTGDSGINTISVRIDMPAGSQVQIRDTDAAELTESSDACSKTGSGPTEVVTCPYVAAEQYAVKVFGHGDNDTITMDGVNGSLPVRFFGGLGNDTLQGAGGPDLLHGEDNNDFLYGGGGADFLSGDKGADLVDGEDGTDFAIEKNDDDSSMPGDPSDHGDTYLDSGIDPAERDVLDFAFFDSIANAPVRVSVGDTDPDGENAGEEDDDVQNGYEEIKGTGGDDVIVGGDIGESLLGEEGDDQLTGAGGADGLFGAEGVDTLYARDGADDASIHCFTTNPGTDVGGETAIVDALPFDERVTDCETVSRPGSDPDPDPDPDPSATVSPTPQATSPVVRPPALTKAPSITGTLAAGSTITCDPGAWSGNPTFAITWHVGQPPAPAGTGATVPVTEAHEGKTLTCSVRATNEAGFLTARVLRIVPEVERMPDLVGKPYADGKRALETAYGSVDFGSDSEQDRRGKGIDQIPCAQGGLKGSCDKAKLQPGDVYVQTPKAGTVLAAPGLGAPLLQVTLSYYDASKDEPKPVAGSPKKYGDNCPLRASYDDDRRDAWLDGLIGEEEKRAKDEIARVECDVVIKASKSETTKDPYVLDTRVVGSGGKRRVELKVSRPRYQDLAIIVMHYRIRGTGLPGQRFDPGLGRDGQLTTHKSQENQICFIVHETATGRPVDGAEITGTDPTGTPVRGDGGRPLKLKTVNGLKCGFFNIVEEGTYTFDFRYPGANGMDQEGRLLIGATDRNFKPFTLWSGYNLEYSEGSWILAKPKTAAVARVASVQDDLASALRFILSPFVALGSGITSLVDALSNPEKSLSFKVVGESPGPKPAVLAGDGKLKPALAPPTVGRGSNMVAAGAGNLIGLDGATMVAAGGGNMVAAGGMNGQKGGGMVAAGGGNLMGAKTGLIGLDGATLIGLDGATLIGLDGATIVSRDGAGLIGQDGGTLVAAGGGNVMEVEGRSVIADTSNRLAPGTMVAAGAGNAIPVAPMVAAGAGN